MAGPLDLFSDLEHQVIALAARSRSECAPVAGGPVRRALARMVRGLVADGSGKPLANPRLETLRRLACVTFATEGRPAENSIRSALQAGFSTEQVEALMRLASGFRPQPQ